MLKFKSKGKRIIEYKNNFTKFTETGLKASAHV